MHQTVKVDTQSAYPGTVNRDNLVKSVSLMSNMKDPRAPVKLSAEELESHRGPPELAAFLLERSCLIATPRTECKVGQSSRNPSTQAISGVPQAHWLDQ